ncbi:MAG: hypothetical protein O7D86_04560 [Proteobacteria bacterium]|nr:hypothetical protein [Pseudomonadota bacterium]
MKGLGIKNPELADIEKPDTILGNWYANIFTLDRRKTIIFMNERTLLSFIILGIRKDNIKNFPIVFFNGIERVLTMEDIDPHVIEKVLSEYTQIVLTKTDNKRLLGSMNDLVSLYTHFILYDGGLKQADLFEVIARINRTLQRNLDWQYSIEAVKDILYAKQQ